MRKLAFFVLVSVTAIHGVAAQKPRTDFWGSPREVIQQYWDMGVAGDLLTANGWSRAAGFFTEPTPQPGEKTFKVFSNYYGVDRISITADKAEIDMDYDDVGRIDATLRYSPPAKRTAFKTAIAFQLTLTPTYLRMFSPDGKTEIGRKPTGDFAWMIEGRPTMPWTTVNTAIRYVLEIRSKTTDPTVKKNADETLAKLLTLH